jgi:hypothetical protein
MTALGSRGTGQAGRPTWWASVVVRTATLPLPSEHRWRYRQEFLAELYGMTPAEQRHHAIGVLSRIGRHRWQRLRNPEGGWYRECPGFGPTATTMMGGNVFSEKRWPIP